MNNYDWYYLTNLDEFLDTGLVSRELEIIFPTGLETILLTRGNVPGILFRTVFLGVGLNSKNPFEFEGFATYYDADGGVWIGVLNDED